MSSSWYFFVRSDCDHDVAVLLTAPSPGTQWGGFTTRWYTELFSSNTIMTALYNTLLIAFLSSIIAVIIGTAAAIAINNMKRVPPQYCDGNHQYSMLNADIVTGISP